MRALAFFVLSILPVPLMAAAPRLLTPAQFQEKLAATRQPDFRRPGVVAAAVRVGEPIVFAAAGQREISERIPATPGTSYPWYSVTKLLTTVAVMQLVERGKVGLDVPLSAYVPEFKPDLKGFQAPTVAHFLSHSSGIPALNPFEKFRAIHLAAEPAPKITDLLLHWTKPGEPLQFEPGSRYQYSNVGFLWLGLLIERVSGEPYEEYIQKKILKPLKMHATGFAHADLNNAARGYARSGSLSGVLGALLGDERFDAGKVFGYRAIRHYYVDGPSYAGLVGPVSDLARFALCLLQEGQLEGKRILSVESARRMRQPQPGPGGKPLQCGLGWFVEDKGGEAVLYHEGLGGGFKTQLRLYPQRGYGMLVAANDAEYDTFEVCGWVVSAPD